MLPTPLPGRRERQVDSTRARLFHAAIAEFRRVGFARASVSRIADQARVSRPSFYFHFPTKAHVLLELEWLEECALVERIEPARTLREALHELTEGLIEIERRLGDSDLFRDMFTIYARRPADLRVEAQPYPIVAALARHFGEAAERGELRAGLEPDAAARVCLLSVFGHLSGPPRPPAKRRADLALLFSLYLAEGGGDRRRKHRSS
ncbi:MAG TPA: TetR/AcrR family transcriptional regulator [Myxococcota bacterium]|nr:TetR/AcrR family transcriptional regulator [Myxococcota bacterium]